MLTIEGRAGQHFAWGLRKLHGKPDRLHGAERGVIDLDDHLTRQRLRVAERLQHVVNGPARHTLLVQRRQPMRPRPGAEALAEDRLELLQVRHAVGAGDEARIGGELARVERFQHQQPMLLVGAADHEPAVGGLEGLVRRVERMGRAHRARRGARGERDSGLPIGLHQRGLVERGLDPLPFAGLEAMGVGGQNAHACEQTRGDVRQRRTAFDGRSIRALAGEAHDPAHRLCDEVKASAVLVGTGAAEAGQ